VGIINAETLRKLRQNIIGSKFVRDTAALQIGKLVATGLAFLSYIISLRLLGPSEYGVYGLVLGFITLLYSFDFTGMGTTASTLLGIAIGKRDQAAILDTMAAFMRVSWMIHAVGLTFLWIFGRAVAGALYSSGNRIGLLAAVIALALPADSIYALINTTLLARRQMRSVAVLQVLNQLTWSLSIVVALVIHPYAESMIVARLFYSYSTMLLACAMYARLRHETDLPFPGLMRVFRSMSQVKLRQYLGVGFANAVDKSLGSLLLSLPQQMIGVMIGERAAGYLISATNGVNNLSLLTSALFDTMRAVIPQRVGKGDFPGLWQVMGRVLLALLLGSLVVYGALALLAPFIIPPLLGEDWRNIVPVLSVAALFGAISTVTGVFGPLYRALNRVWSAIFIKFLIMGVVIGMGYLFLHDLVLMTSGINALNTTAAVGGAWMVNTLYAGTGFFTGWMSLRALQRENRRSA
jgi:O-antigen/teichoic acid export membrane protein